MATVKKKYKSKKEGLSTAEQAAAKVESETLSFWNSLATTSAEHWNRPWMINMTKAESGGKYLLGGERYVYSGGFNQLLIAYGSRDKGPMGPVILNRGDILKIFNVEKFEDTPIAGSKNSDGEWVPGVKSVTSIFRPSTYTRWFNKDGSLWQPPAGSKAKYPSKENISTLGLYKKNTTGSFKSFPVWSLEDIYSRLPPEAQANADKLMAERLKKGYEFDELDDFHNQVKMVVDDMIDRNGVKVKYGSNKAFYSVTSDEISLPHAEQFINPLEWLSTAAHEIAHSTMHLTGRNPLVRSNITYAIEEVVAESVSALIVRRFEEDIKHITKSRPDIKEMFDNYYQQASLYVKDYGSQVELKEMVDLIENKHKMQSEGSDKGAPIIKSMLTNIAKTMDILLEQTVTPEKRLEALGKNMSDPKWTKDLDNKRNFENTVEVTM
jgi:hypothetical protein